VKFWPRNGIATYIQRLTAVEHFLRIPARHRGKVAVLSQHAVRKHLANHANPPIKEEEGLLPSPDTFPLPLWINLKCI